MKEIFLICRVDRDFRLRIVDVAFDFETAAKSAEELKSVGDNIVVLRGWR